ncbi:hypothetical protein BFX83_16440 [Komagataeibacter xylinus]|nr:hypothetical protein BFX83_16440 [Komagataeibacter xylinus]
MRHAGPPARPRRACMAHTCRYVRKTGPFPDHADWGRMMIRGCRTGIAHSGTKKAKPFAKFRHNSIQINRPSRIGAVAAPVSDIERGPAASGESHPARLHRQAGGVHQNI